MPLALLRQLTLASLMTFGLTACGGSGGGGPEPGSSSSQSSNSSSSSSVSQTSSSSSESSVSSSSSSTSSSVSSSSSSSQPADLEPAPFSFEPQFDVEPGATLTSNTVTVSGIDAVTTISVTGGQYSIGGGAYTDADGEVDLDDEVRVQVTASGNFSTEASATLTIGGISGTFTVTTEAEDTTPNAFGFAPQEGLAPETEVTSEEVEISGINTPVAVNITGGEYRVNGGEFTTEAGELQSGDAVSLRAVTLSGPDQTREVTITIGTETVEWALTTAPDEEPPVGEIAFPPPMSASGAETLTIRGRASDELSDVAEVTLTVHHQDSTVPYTLEPDEETGFAEWQQSITLAPGENRVSLQVIDEAGNELEEPVEVTVVGQDYTAPFPDDEQALFSIEEMLYDEVHNRLLLLGIDQDGGEAGYRSVLAVDLSTGMRSPFAENDGENESLGFSNLGVGAIDPEHNRLIAASSRGGDIYEIDLDTGIGAVLLKSKSGDSASAFDFPEDIVLSRIEAEVIYILSASSAGSIDGDHNRLLKVNLATGDREVISDPEAGVGSGPDFGVSLRLAVSKEEEWAYLQNRNELFKVSLTNGDRESIPLDFPTDNSISIKNMFLSDEDDELYIIELYKGLMKLDNSTGEWTVLHPYTEGDDFDSGLAEGVHLVPKDDYLFVAQDMYKAVSAYDLITNEFVVITRYSE
ncbi:hypothetical protein OOT55_16210 [Marinimicrobium sp. C6131]|uniref:hypothetical protein n=1 Tax=Marinimicrobium sp. C6131 TaxID=3022676 RepID=UPI00223CA16F|nr:hypothetical protein [Marinimicrobium sp. C6131]UZJ44184.1 hypothetical protein OOT55_16210 [Marinimicrobium sp. C6131]